MKGKISEVFESIQGEGLYLGEKQIFVRFFGCNLNCAFCDTKLDTFKEYESQELFEELKSYAGPFHSISFTGGEPLLQSSFLKEILELTYNAGFKNYLETNGILFDALEEIVDYLHIVAMDLKLPSSTGLGDFWPQHRRFLDIAAQKEVFLKTVICSSTQEKDIKEAIKLIKESLKHPVLVLQPNSFELNAQMTQKLRYFKEICLKENILVRLIPQMHKVWGVK